jgi:hypothetical protein
MDQSVAVGEVGIYADQCRLLAQLEDQAPDWQFPLLPQHQASPANSVIVVNGPNWSSGNVG